MIQLLFQSDNNKTVKVEGEKCFFLINPNITKVNNAIFKNSFNTFCLFQTFKYATIIQNNKNFKLVRHDEDKGKLCTIEFGIKNSIRILILISVSSKELKVIEGMLYFLLELNNAKRSNLLMNDFSQMKRDKNISTFSFSRNLVKTTTLIHPS